MGVLTFLLTTRSTDCPIWREQMTIDQIQQFEAFSIQIDKLHVEESKPPTLTLNFRQ